MNEWILGLGGADHDFSAALVQGQDIRVAIEQERLTRRKHGLSFWYENPVKRAIDYCLSSEAISIEKVAMIVASDVLPSRVRHDLRSHILRLFPHHLCHAASAYMMLPHHPKAGILVYDGYGSVLGVGDDSLRNIRETFSFYIFTENRYERIGGGTGLGYIETEGYPPGVTNSIGMFYELLTGLLGFDSAESGKTMGLSSHGAPRYLEALEKFVVYGNQVTDCFKCATDDPALVAMIEQILRDECGSFAVKADLAASGQALINKTLLHCARFFCDYDIEYLLISGGCGLNTVANSFLVDNSPLSGVPIVIPPHCGDSGLSFGALWLELFHRHNGAPNMTFRGKMLSPSISRPGRQYTPDERRQATLQFYPRIALDVTVTSARDVARILAEGSVIGVLNGRSEIGPRALGGRSIFADPRSAMMKEKINRLIKKREPFRPFAPVVLRSHYNEYFLDERCMDQFMLKTSRVKERCLRDAPAVVHVDGTARVQIVQDDDDPFIIELLRAFYEITGVGILINTSFNRRGEPIVESPIDAFDAFLGLAIDGLYIDGEFYRPITSVNSSI